MKIGRLSQKLKSRTRKYYVRKKEFDLLTKEVKRLTKKVAKLEECCEPDQSEKTDTDTKEKKVENQTAESTVSGLAAAQDELTRIRGIGPVLEKKLNGLGITRFSQIASWNEEEIDGFSEHLNFKGRIQREDWVEQAKDLAE